VARDGGGTTSCLPLFLAVGGGRGRGHRGVLERLLRDPRIDPSATVWRKMDALALACTKESVSLGVVTCLLSDRRARPSLAALSRPLRATRSAALAEAILDHP
jgi:hypothetical protein